MERNSFELFGDIKSKNHTNESFLNPKKGITHFGRQYTHAQKRSAEEEFSEYEQHFLEQEPLEQWTSLSKNTLKGIYRHFWLDFILLGYDVNEATDIIDLGHD